MSRHDKTIHNSNTRIQFSFTWASPRLSAVCPACGIPAKLGKKKQAQLQTNIGQAGVTWLTGSSSSWILRIIHISSQGLGIWKRNSCKHGQHILIQFNIYVYMSTYQFNDILYTVYIINYTIHSSLLICTQMYCALDKEAIKTCQNYSVI